MKFSASVLYPTRPALALEIASALDPSGADASTFNCVRIPAPRWLCYHCIYALMMAVDPRGDDHAQSHDLCERSWRNGAEGLHVVRNAKTSSCLIRTAAGGLPAAPLTARKLLRRTLPANIPRKRFRQPSRWGDLAPRPQRFSPHCLSDLRK